MIDDGAKSVDISIALLRLLAKQGVKRVCATPHFDAQTDSLKQFFEKRESSYNSLKEKIEKEDGLPKILLGAEVKYYVGIGSSSEIGRLAIEEENLLLLEIPFSKWHRSILNEVCKLAYFSQFRVVIAHAERCRSFFNKKTRNLLLSQRVLFQCNESFFQKRRTRKKALKLYREGVIHFIASDCHGIDYRAPQMDKTAKIIDSVKKN